MAFLSAGFNTKYIDYLLDAYGPYSQSLLDLYTAECCVGFISEMGQLFNGIPVEVSRARKAKLQSILFFLLEYEKVLHYLILLHLL